MSGTTTPKICVLGLDGATWDIVDQWLDDLPTMQRFRDTLSSELDSTVPPLSVPAWKVYATGQSPGRLGVYHFVDVDKDERSFNTVDNETFTAKEIWDYLGADGLESAVINLPGTTPPRPIDGYMVSGPFANENDFARPESLQTRLAEDGYEVLPDYYLDRDPEQIPAALDAAAQRLSLAADLADDVHFVHVTLYIIDTVQHVECDSKVAHDFWVELDAILGEFVDALGPEWNVVMMSDHGFGRSDGRFYLNTWLEREGYLAYDDSSTDVGDVAAWFGLDFETIFSVIQTLRLEKPLRTVFPTDFLVELARQMPGNRRLQGIENKIDWNSDAFALPPLIFTRTRDIAEQVRADLLHVTDSTGTSVVDDVFFIEDQYPDAAGTAPDLIVKHSEYDFPGVFDPTTLIEEHPTDGIVAHHRRNGILAARGPDVEGLTTSTPRLVDLAPTLLDAYGVPIPTRLSGESLELFGSHSTTDDVPIDREGTRATGFDEDIEAKLRDLGYV